MTVDNINVEATIKKVQELLAQEPNLSPALRSTLDVLLLVVQLLANRLGLNSRNSSKPPSTDFVKGDKKTKDGTNKPGGQLGRVGTTLSKVDDPDEIKLLEVDRASLPPAQYRDIGFESRQVFDIDIQRIVTEYRAQILEDENLDEAQQAKLEKRFSNGIYIVNSFTWSHALDVAAANQELNNNDSPVVDRYDNLGTYTRSAYDRPLNDSLALVADLPFGKNRRFGSSASAPLQFLLSDWQVTALNYLITGLPINISYAPSTAQQLSTETSFLYRPNLNGNPVLGSGNRTAIAGYPGQYRYLDPSVITIPDPATTSSPYGNCSRNVARAPGYAQLDLGLHKRFPLGFQKVGLEFRAEAFDVLNHSNAQAPDAVATNATYGIVSSYLPPRAIQLALKLVF